MKVVRFVSIAAFVLLCGSLFAKQSLPRLTIEAHYEPVRLAVGGIMRVELRFAFPTNYQLVGIATNRSKQDYKLSISKKNKITIVGAQQHLRVKASLQVFEIKEFFFPGFVVEYKDPQQKKHRQLFGMCVVHVVPPLINTKKKPLIRDVYGPLDISSDFPWLLVVIAVLLVAAVFYYWGRYSARKKEDPSLLKRGEDPWAFVQRRLQEINSLFPESPKQAKQFYFLLTETVKRYLSLRSGLPVLEATTSELSGFLEKITWCVQDAEAHLLSLFQEADLVKFAGYLPAAEEIELYYNSISNWLSTAEDGYQAELAAREESSDGV